MTAPENPPPEAENQEAEVPKTDPAKADMSDSTPKTDKPQPNVPHHPPPPLDPLDLLRYSHLD